MTDLEITKLCAEAMGWRTHSINDQCYYNEGEHMSMLKNRYDPLHDDAQAMALVKKFDLQITGDKMKRVGPFLWKGPYVTNIDLNRAICECVAKMQAFLGAISKGSK